MSRPKGSKNKKNFKRHTPLVYGGPAVLAKDLEDDFKSIAKGYEQFKVTLKSLGKYYYAEGASVLEAILSLKVEKARGVSVLTIEKDGLKKEKILGPRMTAKLFGGGSPLDKEILLKKYYADIL